MSSNNSVPGSVTRATLQGREDVPLIIGFYWEPENPFEVRCYLWVPEQPTVTWLFARELLRGGGVGDVKITEWGDNLQVTLAASQAGETGVSMLWDKAEVAHFLAKTEAMIPIGHEPDLVDWDGLLQTGELGQ